MEKRQLVERDTQLIAAAQQCELLDSSRSSYYSSYFRDDENNIKPMRLSDEKYT